MTALKLNLSGWKPGNLNLGKRQPRSSLLALALDGRRLEAVLLRRTNGSVRAQTMAAAPLELNLLTDQPELVGHEIRNHLDRAGIRERQCIVCIPLEWALTAHVAVPEMPAEDVESFLAIEAERAFPFSAETLSLRISRCRGADGSEFATLLGIPKDHLHTLQKVMKAAQLRPVSFSLGMPALLDPATSKAEGVAALWVGENSVELQVACGGGIAALRVLQGALEQDGVRRKPYADVVARDLRITLGQLPPALRQSIHQLKVFGHGDDLARFAEDLAARAKLMGLAVELVGTYGPGALELEVPAQTAISPAFSSAARSLAGRPPVWELLPPKVSAWKQFTDRYSSGKLAAAGMVAAALVLMVIAAFSLQQWQLRRWRSQWNRIKVQVADLDRMQQQIRQFRPWFDDSFRSLSILQRITDAFPEDGSVYAKTVEIRDPGSITCSGTARDQQALLKVVDRLRASQQFTSVQIDQIRGKQFTLNLRWGAGGNL